MEHTPIPWQWNKHEDDDEAGPYNPGYLFAPEAPYSMANEQHPGEYVGVSVLHCIYPSRGDRYARLSCSPEDAAFIVQAVNSHQALVEALDEALRELETIDGNLADGRETYVDGIRLELVRTALKQARGER